MIWALRLLGIGRSILSGLRSAARWTFKQWERAGMIAALLLAGFWYLSSDKWQGRAEKATRIADYRGHMNEGFKKFIRTMSYNGEKAAQAQIAMSKAQKATYTANKEKADARYKIAVANNARFERMVAAGRVRPASGGGEAVAGNTATQGADTGLPETMPGNTVMVDETELRRTNELAVIGLSALNWAYDSIKSGVAE